MREEIYKPYDRLPWPTLLVMAAITFFALISELLPSGLLMEMSQGLNASAAEVGNLVGIYALPAAIVALPVTQLVAPFNRKHILMGAVFGFAASNLIVAFSSSYFIALLGRLIGGASAGVLWPIIGSYASQTVSDHLSGRAITIVFAGSTLGLSIGVPTFTTIGQTLGWRASYAGVAAGFIILALLGYFILLSVPGSEPEEREPLSNFLKHPGIQKALIIVFLMVIGHYTTYLFIQIIAEMHGVNLQTSQMLFGIGAIIMVIIVSKYIDHYFARLLLTVFTMSVAVMFIFLFGSTTSLIYTGMFFWGMAYGPMTTLLQHVVLIQVPTGKDTAAALQTVAFDSSILIASLVGGMLLNTYTVRGNLIFAAVLFVIAAWMVIRYPETFD